MLARVPFDGVQLSLPQLSSSQIEGLTGWARVLARLYERARRWPLVRSLVLWIAPVLAFSGRVSGGTRQVDARKT